MLHFFTCKITISLLWKLSSMECVLTVTGVLVGAKFLVNACFSPLLMVLCLRSSMNWPWLLEAMWHPAQSVAEPHGPKGACPHFKEGTHGQHQMITESTEWQRVIVAATSVTLGLTGPSHPCKAPCRHEGWTATSSLLLLMWVTRVIIQAAGWNISTDSRVSSAEGHTVFHMTPAQHCWVL